MTSQQPSQLRQPGAGITSVPCVRLSTVGLQDLGAMSSWTFHLSSNKRVFRKNFWLQKSCNFLLSEARVAMCLCLFPFTSPAPYSQVWNCGTTQSLKGMNYKWKEYSNLFFSIFSHVLLRREQTNTILLQHIWQGWGFSSGVERLLQSTRPWVRPSALGKKKKTKKTYLAMKINKLVIFMSSGSVVLS